MDREFWLQRWVQGEIGFHQREFNPYLLRYWETLGISGGAKVFIPLCGKSLDMVWLMRRGHPVLGVEFSRDAVEQFFQEIGLKPRQLQRGPFLRYCADGVELLAGDFFDLTTLAVGFIGAVYDRAALVALPPALRPLYVEHMASLLCPGVPMLLIAFEYAQEQMAGPPFAVLESEVLALYQPHFELDVLAETEVLTQYPRFRVRGLTNLHERVYRLIRRG